MDPFQIAVACIFSFVLGFGIAVLISNYKLVPRNK